MPRCDCDSASASDETYYDSASFGSLCYSAIVSVVFEVTDWSAMSMVVIKLPNTVGVYSGNVTTFDLVSCECHAVCTVV